MDKIKLALPTNLFNLYHAWVKDLKETKEKQGRHSLGGSSMGFCCLGRLCVVEGILFNDVAKEPPMGSLSLKLTAKINSMLGRIPNQYSLAGMNDYDGLTFLQIAERLEEVFDVVEEKEDVQS